MKKPLVFLLLLLLQFEERVGSIGAMEGVINMETFQVLLLIKGNKRGEKGKNISQYPALFASILCIVYFSGLHLKKGIFIYESSNGNIEVYTFASMIYFTIYFY